MPDAAIPPCSVRLHGLFVVYLQRYFAKHFNAVRLSRGGAPPAPAGSPAIVYLNHPSWWDPIVIMLMAHHAFFGRKGYGPMDAAFIDKYGFFKRFGVFGVEQGTSRGARKFLRTAKAILSQREPVLWLTPQGRFSDPRERPLRFEPGLGHLVRHVGAVHVQPMALDYSFWSERHPELLIRFGPARAIDDGRSRSADEWTRAFEEDLASTMDALASDAASRDPDRFVSLLSGRAGVGGVYDAFGRVRALLRGERFEPEHLARRASGRAEESPGSET